MRASVRVVLLAAVLLSGLTIALPAAALLAELVRPVPSDMPPVPTRGLLEVAVTTATYASIVTVGAVLLGWAPGRWLGRRWRRGSSGPLAFLLLTPLVLPAYVLFYTWWQAWPPDSSVYAWAVTHGHVPLLRGLTLVTGLVLWSWPLVAWCVALASTQRPTTRDELLVIDDASWTQRTWDHMRTDALGVVLGAALVLFVTANNTTCFDLAQIFTFGNELRAIDAAGAGAGPLLRAALPAVGLALAGAGLVWWLMTMRVKPLPLGHPPRRTREIVVTLILWCVSVLLPMVFLLARFLELERRRGSDAPSAAGEFLTLYGSSLVSTAGVALAVGALGTLLAIGFTLAWHAGSRSTRLVAHALAFGWMTAALVPGTIVGVALEAAYNRPLPLGGAATVSDLVYSSPVILVLGLLARCGFVAVLLAWWCASREPAALREMRRVDGVDTLVGLLATAGPRVRAACLATFAVSAALAFGEIPVTARVHPPGTSPLAVALLNAMHYQRPETVVLAALLILGAALLATGLAVLLVTRPIAWRPAILALASGLLATVPGCGRPDAGAALEPTAIFGANGTALGQFSYPRCLAIDGPRGVLYVIDKTARVQRFALNGEPEIEWVMPAKENGKPTGVSVAPDGRVFVADTHYHRIIAYDADGHELLRFGRYGEGPGEFIYPTDVAFGPRERLYVAEYGGHDRVQVFSPEGRYLFEFGAFGSGPGHFDRPQAMLFNADRTELIIADACNHRIVIVDPQGRELRVFGRAGTGAGELHYPYGLTLLDDGTLLVAEFGNNRIQHFTTTGRSLGLFGHLGAGPGELRYPWDVAGAGDAVYVLDSGNNRIQRIRRP